MNDEIVLLNALLITMKERPRNKERMLRMPVGGVYEMGKGVRVKDGIVVEMKNELVSGLPQAHVPGSGRASISASWYEADGELSGNVNASIG